LLLDDCLAQSRRDRYANLRCGFEPPRRGIRLFVWLSRARLGIGDRCGGGGVWANYCRIERKRPAITSGKATRLKMDVLVATAGFGSTAV
jgi:hypothetical protein